MKCSSIFFGNKQASPFILVTMFLAEKDEFFFWNIKLNLTESRIRACASLRKTIRLVHIVYSLSIDMSEEKTASPG